MIIDSSVFFIRYLCVWLVDYQFVTIYIDVDLFIHERIVDSSIRVILMAYKKNNDLN